MIAIFLLPPPLPEDAAVVLLELAPEPEAELELLLEAELELLLEPQAEIRATTATPTATVVNHQRDLLILAPFK